MNDMMNIVTVLFFVGIVGVPLVMGIFTGISDIAGYEPPRSVAEALKGHARSLPVMLVLFVANNWSRVGFAFDRWYWGMLIFIPIVVALALIVDWLIIRHREKRTAI